MCGYHQALSNNQWLLRNVNMKRYFFYTTRVEIFLIKKPVYLLSFRSFTVFISSLSIFRKIQSSHFRVTLKTHFHESWSILFHFLLENYNRLLYIIIDLWFDIFLFMNVCNLSFVTWCLQSELKIQIQKIKFFHLYFYVNSRSLILSIYSRKYWHMVYGCFAGWPQWY